MKKIETLNLSEEDLFSIKSITPLTAEVSEKINYLVKDFGTFERIKPQLDTLTYFQGKKIAFNEARVSFSSSGSTGTPKITPLLFSEVEKNSMIHGFGYSQCGITQNDIVATWGLPGILSSEFTVYLALKHTSCEILPIGEFNKPDRVYETLVKFGATVLLVMPSDLIPLIQFLESSGKKLNNIRLVVAGGEALRDVQKKYFSQYLGENIQFRSVYQSSESGSMGYQCAHCDNNEYHLHHGYQYFELLPLENSDIGELLCTNLWRTWSPIIRFKTGDLVKVTLGTCTCGNNLPRIRILSRMNSVTKLGGERFDYSHIETVIHNLNLDIADFQVQIVSDHKGKDILRFFSNKLFSNSALQNEVIEIFIKKVAKFDQQIRLGVIGRPEFYPYTATSVCKTATGKMKIILDQRGGGTTTIRGKQDRMF